MDILNPSGLERQLCRPSVPSLRCNIDGIRALLVLADISQSKVYGELWLLSSAVFSPKSDAKGRERKEDGCFPNKVSTIKRLSQRGTKTPQEVERPVRAPPNRPIKNKRGSLIGRSIAPSL